MQLPETFIFEKRYWYPHMMPEDRAIWERFIEKYPDAYDTVQYDVPCGSDPEFNSSVQEEIGGNAIKLYKKKIDVLAFKGDAIDIIELKPKAGASAVGQVKMYKNLYIKDYTPPVTPRCVLITDAANSDVREFAQMENVNLFIV